MNKDAPSTSTSPAECCIHCGAWRIVGDLPRACPGCGRFLCPRCARLAGPTQYCPMPDSALSPRPEKDRAWMEHLERESLSHPGIASLTRLRDLVEKTARFHAAIDQNLETGLARWQTQPRISSRARPWHRVLGIDTVKSAAPLFEDWHLPNWPARDDEPWQPPAQWLDLLQQARRVTVRRIGGLGCRATWTIAATLAPVEFIESTGPVLARAGWGSVESIVSSVSTAIDPDADVFAAIGSPAGWAAGACSAISPRRVIVLASHPGATWSATLPAIDSVSRSGQRLAALLRPLGATEIASLIETEITTQLQCADVVLGPQIREGIRRARELDVLDAEVLGAFDRLAATGQYMQARVNDRPALRRTGFLASLPRWKT